MTCQFTNFQSNEQTIVALHSSASAGSQWKSLAQEAEGRYRTIAPDLSGYGKSDSSDAQEMNDVISTADRIIQLIERQQLPVHLVGHSNGAGIALKVCLMRPDLIKSLSLYEPATFHFLKNGSAQERGAFQKIDLLFGILSASLASGSNAIGMGAFIDFWNGKGAWDRLSRQAKEKLALQGMTVMADFVNGFNESWCLDDLRNIKLPTLIMMGMESPNVAQIVAKRIATTIPTARLAMVPNLNHMAPVFQPNWVNPRILQHIASVERPMSKLHWPVSEAA